MKHVTKLTICLELCDDDTITEVLEDLPEYCLSTFQDIGDNCWFGEFPVSCSIAPKLAEGDFVDDLCPYFPALLRLKRLYSARFELHIAVGEPAEEFWNLEDYSVSLLAALGASIRIHTATWTIRTEKNGTEQPAPESKPKDQQNSPG